MFPEQIFGGKSVVVPDIQVNVLRHIDLGQRVIRTQCEVNGFPAKRITQDIYGKPVNKIPVWSIGERIVADWFAVILEEKYQATVAGQTTIIYPDIC